ncbi:MAG: hypothetical protein K1X83_03510 [Oligoflexia bacterium]|nr:hypothetical protein [Oligoflexia bacterium]
MSSYFEGTLSNSPRQDDLDRRALRYLGNLCSADPAKRAEALDVLSTQSGLPPVTMPLLGQLLREALNAGRDNDACDAIGCLAQFAETGSNLVFEIVMASTNRSPQVLTAMAECMPERCGPWLRKYRKDLPFTQQLKLLPAIIAFSQEAQPDFEFALCALREKPFFHKLEQSELDLVCDAYFRLAFKVLNPALPTPSRARADQLLGGVVLVRRERQEMNQLTASRFGAVIDELAQLDLKRAYPYEFLRTVHAISKLGALNHKLIERSLDLLNTGRFGAGRLTVFEHERILLLQLAETFSRDLSGEGNETVVARLLNTYARLSCVDPPSIAPPELGPEAHPAEYQIEAKRKESEQTNSAQLDRYVEVFSALPGEKAELPFLLLAGAHPGAHLIGLRLLQRLPPDQAVGVTARLAGYLENGVPEGTFHEYVKTFLLSARPDDRIVQCAVLPKIIDHFCEQQREMVDEERRSDCWNDRARRERINEDLESALTGVIEAGLCGDPQIKAALTRLSSPTNDGLSPDISAQAWAALFSALSPDEIVENVGQAVQISLSSENRQLPLLIAALVRTPNYEETVLALTNAITAIPSGPLMLRLPELCTGLPAPWRKMICSQLRIRALERGDSPAIRTLGFFGREGAAELAAIVDQASSTGQIARVLDAAFRFGGAEEYHSVAVAALTNPHASSQQRCSVLSRMLRSDLAGDRRVAIAVREILEHGNIAEAADAAKLFAHWLSYGARECFEPLRMMCQDLSASRREAGVRALAGALEQPGVPEILDWMRRDRDPEIRALVRQILR